MIDIHILHLPEREAWLQECLKTLEHPACTVHVLPGVEPQDFGAGRAKGYSLGTQPWVVQVGDDDFVLPGAWDALVEAIEQYPDADYFQTQYYKLYPDRMKKSGFCSSEARGEIHIYPNDHRFYFCENLIAYRRTVAHSLQDSLRSQGAKADGWFQGYFRKNCYGVYIPKPYFVWRSHQNSLHTWIMKNGFYSC